MIVRNLCYAQISDKPSAVASGPLDDEIMWGKSTGIFMTSRRHDDDGGSEGCWLHDDKKFDNKPYNIIEGEDIVAGEGQRLAKEGTGG